MNRLGFTRVAGACAVLYTPAVIVAIYPLTSSGLVGIMNARDILPIMVEHRTTVAIGAWLVAVSPVLLSVVGLGLLGALRRAGDLMWVAALAFIGGSLLVLISAIVRLAMIYWLAPAYATASGDVQAALVAVGATLGGVNFIAGDMLGGFFTVGVGVPLFSAGILRTKIAPRWVAWLGFAVAVTGGLFNLLVPLGEVFELVSFVGFTGFCVWLVALGIKLWRLPEPVATA